MLSNCVPTGENSRRFSQAGLLLFLPSFPQPLPPRQSAWHLCSHLQIHPEPTLFSYTDKLSSLSYLPSFKLYVPSYPLDSSLPSSTSPSPFPSFSSSFLDPTSNLKPQTNPHSRPSYWSSCLHQNEAERRCVSTLVVFQRRKD